MSAIVSFLHINSKKGLKPDRFRQNDVSLGRKNQKITPKNSVKTPLLTRFYNIIFRHICGKLTFVFLGLELVFTLEDSSFRCCFT